MKRALEQATTAKSLKPEQRATARGYLNDLAKPTNIFLLHFLGDVLESMEHLTQSFQTINSSLMACMDILDSVRLDLENHRATYCERYIHIASLLGLENASSTITDQGASSSAATQGRQKRHRTLPSHFSDSVVTTPMPQ